MLQTYNELANGNLPKYMYHVAKYCDTVCIYDDGSNDGTMDYVFDVWDPWIRGMCLIDGTDHNWKLRKILYINGFKNDFKNELTHKQMQLEKCKENGVDWILRLDADETLDARAIPIIRETIKNTKYPSFAFHTINLWRSPCFYRLDNSYNSVVFNRLWKLSPEMQFNVQEGLHLTNYPIGATDGEGMFPYEIIHWGFASDEAILNKYKMYLSHGQNGWALNRLVDESTLKVAKSNKNWFEGPIPDDKFEDVFSCPIESKL